MPIRAAQNRHRPRDRVQLSTGTSSSGPSTCPHDGHLERPCAHDSPRGNRHDSAVTPLPKIAPSRQREMPMNTCMPAMDRFPLVSLEWPSRSLHNASASAAHTREGPPLMRLVLFLAVVINSLDLFVTSIGIHWFGNGE